MIPKNLKVVKVVLHFEDKKNSQEGVFLDLSTLIGTNRRRWPSDNSSPKPFRVINA